MAEPVGKMEEKTNTVKKEQEFDFINWFYWSLWWQQCSYFVPPPLYSPSPQSVGSSATPNGRFPMPPGNSLTPQPNALLNPGIGIQIRIINGFETTIPPLWKRLVAEVIDIFLFSLILKFYIPDFEYRVPEVFFESDDVWHDISDEELHEIRELVVLFVASTVVQRFAHAVFETLMLFYFGWTPGKWLLGLRVMRCTQSHFTRTVPGSSIRIEPGGKLTFFQSLLRALFKATVSAFIPLIVFFIHIYHGRTRYDKMFRTIVVDTSSLHRPLFAEGQSISVNFNQARNNAGPHVRLEVR